MGPKGEEDSVLSLLIKKTRTGEAQPGKEKGEGVAVDR
jgi:hypothetical protein